MTRTLRSRSSAGVDEWLRRGERHWQLVGATRDARSTRVLLDTQLAIAGDAEAERRLLAIADAVRGDEMDAGQANLGLAELAWRRHRLDEASRRADALARAVADVSSPDLIQQRIVFQIAAAVIRLWVAESRPITAGLDIRAADTLRHSRGAVLAAHD
ncbi:MAG TPA: hypothetical protein VHZ97_10790, partial [Pseudonocardiaceae bacterium]|nr:hypothetical protein [Pseudonocardiaceae bacterium]